jgi:hypothetical protein
MIRIEEIGLYFYHFEVIYEGGDTEHTPAYQLTVFSPDYETPECSSRESCIRFSLTGLPEAGIQAPLQNKNYILGKIGAGSR